MAHEVGDRISRDRIVTLKDGVLAIVMTLLVLEIVVPEISRSEVATELPKRLLELLPVVWSYATSFVILGFFWVAHDDQFHYIKRANRTLLWLTIFYLMFIAFIPFSTALIGGYGDQQISVIIYGINIINVLVWTYLQWKYATKEHRLVDSDLDPKLIVKISRRIVVGMILYMIGDCCFIFKYPSKSYIVYINPRILSHTSTIFLVPVYQRQVKRFILDLSVLLITRTIGPRYKTKTS